MFLERWGGPVSCVPNATLPRLTVKGHPTVKGQLDPMDHMASNSPVTMLGITAMGCWVWGAGNQCLQHLTKEHLV